MDVEARGKKRRRDSAGERAGSAKRGPKVSTAAQVKRAIHQQSESKYFDTGLDPTTIGASGTLALNNMSPNAGVFNPANGAAIAARIGNMTYLSKIRMRCKVATGNPAIIAGGALASTFRVILVRDKEPTPGAAVPLSDVMTNLGSVNADTSTNAMMNPQNLGRFEVLKDKIFVLQDPNISTTGYNQREVNFKIEHVFKTPLKIRFNATTALPVTDTFHVYAWADSVALGLQLSYNCRACFKED